MAERLTVSRDGKPIYDIVLETSFGELGAEVKKLDLGSRKICIVTDSHVAPLYLEEVREIYKARLPAQERSAFFARLFRAALDAGRPLSPVETDALLSQNTPEEELL